MKRKTAALFLAGLMAVSGVISVPVMAEDISEDFEIVLEQEAGEMEVPSEDAGAPESAETAGVSAEDGLIEDIGEAVSFEEETEADGFELESSTNEKQKEIIGKSVSEGVNHEYTESISMFGDKPSDAVIGSYFNTGSTYGTASGSSSAVESIGKSSGTSVNRPDSSVLSGLPEAISGGTIATNQDMPSGSWGSSSSVNSSSHTESYGYGYNAGTSSGSGNQSWSYGVSDGYSSGLPATNHDSAGNQSWSYGVNTGSTSGTSSSNGSHNTGSSSGWNSSYNESYSEGNATSGSSSSTGHSIGIPSGNNGGTVYVLGNFPASISGHSQSSNSSEGGTAYSNSETHTSVSGTSNGKRFSSTGVYADNSKSTGNKYTSETHASIDTHFDGGVTAKATGSFAGACDGTEYSISGQVNAQYSNGISAVVNVYATQANRASNVDLTMSYAWSDGTGENLHTSIIPSYGINTALYYATAYIQYHEKAAPQSQGSTGGSASASTGKPSATQGTSSGSGHSSSVNSGTTSGTTTGHSESHGSSYGQNTGKATGTSVAVGNGTSVSLGRGSNGVSVTNISSNGSSVSVPANVAGQPVREIASGAVSGKAYKSITLTVNGNTKFGKSILKDKKARKAKSVRITSTNGKLRASNFNKKAFKGYKGKLIISKKSMTKKEFNKLKKRLKKGGMKGKIVRK